MRIRSYAVSWSAAVVAAAVFNSEAHAGRTLEHDAVIAAPAADVWAAFTTSEGFASWAVAKAEIDFRIGGEYRTSYNPQSTLHDEHTIVNRILSFDPGRMVSIQNVQAPKGFKNSELFQQTWSVIYITPVDGAPDRTRMHIIGHGYGEGPEWDDIYNKFKVGNAMTLEALQKKFAPNAVADDPAKVMALLGRLVGGEWIHEGKAPDGGVFRVRNVVQRGPDGQSLVSRGWLGGAEGMVEHSASQMWLEPAHDGAPAEVRFCSLNEQGGITRGAIRLIGCDSVEWDWNTLLPNGTTTRHRITTSVLADDRYTMRIDTIGDDGVITKMVEADFTRVEKAPEAFLTMRKATATSTH